MPETCIGYITRASVRHVWDMHRPRDSQASVRPVWDMTSTPLDESQCKTCLGYGISLDTLRVSVRPVWDMASTWVAKRLGK
ncbi:hypothetical protein J1N35_024901 [Gossypium stocksii]|uniref:Uncharacterized protein n=1 Tax=Gossypium stocksii TaxID=47602 RepID=A0A9D3ZXT4_9ROSI|nr:hypothetical protein J1N35_024901 [Gossypium stocksii]